MINVSQILVLSQTGFVQRQVREVISGGSRWWRNGRAAA